MILTSHLKMSTLTNSTLCFLLCTSIIVRQFQVPFCVSKRIIKSIQVVFTYLFLFQIIQHIFEKSLLEKNGILSSKLFRPTVRKKCSNEREQLLKSIFQTFQKDDCCPIFCFWSQRPQIFTIDPVLTNFFDFGLRLDLHSG